MRNEEIYELWKRKRSRVDLGNGLADAVMRQVRQYASDRRRPRFAMHELIERIGRYWPARAALIAAGAATGFVRAMFVVYALLGS